VHSRYLITWLASYHVWMHGGRGWHAEFRRCSRHW